MSGAGSQARATHQPKPPTATAIDDDIYLTVTAAVPGGPGGVEAIDIVLSVEFARAAIAALSSAVTAASRNAAE